MDGLRCLIGGILVSGLMSAGCDVSVKKPAGTVTLMGRVFSAEQGKPAAGVEITAPDGSTVKSGADGTFTVKSEGGKAGALRTKSEAHAPVSKEAPKGDGYVELFVKDVDGKQDIVNKSGGSVKGKEGAAVNVGKESLVDAEGKSPTKARVDIANPDPRRPTDLPSIPGDFDAQKDGKRGKISAESPMHVRAAEGEKSLGLGKGKSMEADLPVRRADSPREGALFRFDEDEQSWVFVRMVERVSNKTGAPIPNAQVDPGEPVYRAELDELGWWAVGEFFDELTCVRACVVDGDGEGVPFARAVATGVDHFTQLTTYADDKGCFALDVRAKAQISLAVQAIDGFVAPVVVETSSMEMSAADDAGKCQDLGELKLKAAEAGDCPLGLRECGTSCVDVRADGENCGECGNECGGSVGRELACVDGLCECPLGQRGCGGDGSVQPTTPGGSTGNVDGPDGAGGQAAMCKVDTDCASGQRCVAGLCSGGATVEPDPTPTDTADAGRPSAPLTGAQTALYCAVLRTDDQNCGGCGIVCGEGSSCVDGACSGDDTGPIGGERDSGVPPDTMAERDAGGEVVVPPPMCGECPNEDLGLPLGVAVGCCTSAGSCGSLVSPALEQLGFEPDLCIERDQPGVPADTCPPLTRQSVTFGTVTLPGCCRPEGQCGFDADQAIAGEASYSFGTGCVSYSDANAVGDPVSCNPMPVSDGGTTLPPTDSGAGTGMRTCMTTAECRGGEVCNQLTGFCEIDGGTPDASTPDAAPAI